jgi:hypothetical protein
LSEHLNVAVGSGEVKVNVDVVELLSAGGLPVTWVIGGVRSTVQSDSPVWATPVPTSVTTNRCSPSDRPDTVCGDGHGLTIAPPSSAHVNVPVPCAWPVGWNTNVPVVWFDWAGGAESNVTPAAAATPGEIAPKAQRTGNASAAATAATPR